MKDDIYVGYKVYGYDFPNEIKIIYDTLGNQYAIPSTYKTETIAEEILFVAGKGTLSKTFAGEAASFGNTIGFKGIKGSTECSITWEEGYPYCVNHYVRYDTRYIDGKALVPASFVPPDVIDGRDFCIYAERMDGVTQSQCKHIPLDASMTTDDSTTSITVVVKDFATDIVIPDASVYIDDVYKGKTDSTGSLTIASITAGNHSIRLTASGYLDSDEDELANDTFTVNATSN